MAEKSKQKDERREPEFQRLPPQAVEVEQAILGAMMLDASAFGRAVEHLDEDSFYRPAHKMIFQAMIKLFTNNEPVDVVTVAEVLRNGKQLEDIGGEYYLAELVDGVSSPASVEYYANIMKDKSVLRRLISSSTDIIDECYRAQTSAGELLDRAQESLFEITSGRQARGFRSMEPVIHDTFEMLEEFHRRKGVVTGLATGFNELDELSSGFQKSEFIVIAARPSMGKTALALNIAHHIARESRLPVAFFSLEMNAQMLAYRMLCAHTRIDSHKVRTGRLKDTDWSRLSIAAGELAELPMYIDDSANLSVLELRARSRRLAMEKGIGAVFLDYLQIMTPPPEAESQQQAVAAISRSLKSLAKELNVPVVAMSQLSRAVETRGGDKKPQLADLRDSGAIEQDADMVMFIWRPAQYKAASDDIPEEERRKAELIVAKQRNGPTGVVDLIFNREYAGFENLTTFQAAEPVSPAEIGMGDDDAQPF
ncbi:replicative DNA helicase [bacterium]|nr:replicative DNA helicase [FCB group bacterium]MBL7190420.1 replicative DNA helicase [bacterium]